MNLKDLGRIIDFARKSFLEFPNNVRLDGMERDLREGEVLALAYYKAITDLLISKGQLINSEEFDIKFIEVDSNPKEDDYYDS